MQTMQFMKTLRMTFLKTALWCVLAALLTSCASEPKVAARPYTLPDCAVCGMKLADEKNPYSFVYGDRQIIVCDKDEAAVFKKEPAKYLKLIEEAEAKAKAGK
jgi:hypothetical protein